MSDSELVPPLGFITVMDHPKFGLTGGFLVLNSVGRPLEFHCTAPVKPNRAQEILFGDTLKPYLYGEQIAQTLIRRLKFPIRYIFTDSAPVLAAQKSLDMPVIFVPQFTEEEDSATNAEMQTELMQDSGTGDLFTFSVKRPIKRRKIPQPLQDIAGLDVSRWKQTPIADTVVWIPDDQRQSIAEIADYLINYTKLIRFPEPFTRIVLALEEAQKAA